MTADLVVRGIGRLLTMTGPGPVPLDGPGAVVVEGGRVVWVGAERDLPSGPDAPEVDAAGALVTPGFVDPHTHLLWAGHRRAELEARIAGEPYDGGGIATTRAATVAASDAQLQGTARTRLASLLAGGTTTVEVKTGYGGSAEQELRCVRLLAGLASERTGPRLEVTYLVHLPEPDPTERARVLADHVAALAEAARAGAVWVDVFCDRGAFTVAEARTVLAEAERVGLGTRLHADQLARTGAAELAAEVGCASADHLDAVDAAGARALAAAGTVAVLLPTAGFTTASAGPDLGLLRDAGVVLALGTDANPGTSQCTSTALVLQHACFGLGMSVEEALRAATTGAAAALRRPDLGVLRGGAVGDLVVHSVEHEVDLVTRLGEHPATVVVREGRPVVTAG